ncbi:MAG: putative DNA binding domain-containing protein [Bacilli bacterium]|nr:putative DNA binding domain-containing protein [Bacilli bacterium]
MEYKESKNIELKEKFSKSLLKTISAFSNYQDGKIYIGVNDLGEVVGVEDIYILKLNVENTINDSITPRPIYKLNILEDEGKMILEIEVYKGEDGPYYYDGKAYARYDTSTVPIDGINLTRLVLKSKNLSFDQVKTEEKNLKFGFFEKYIAEKLKIKQLDEAVFKTLGLVQDGKFNNGAALLADNGQIEQSYVDIARFKLYTDEFLDRVKLNSNSILKYYEEILSYFYKYYSPYQKVEGFTRIEKERVPIDAFRETIANAIVHRDYIIRSGVQIAMFDNRIEVRSPGGLVDGISEKLYFEGLTSVPRNPIISYIFFRLGIIEQFGTGVKKIINSYKKYNLRPFFEIEKEQIRIVLPVIDYDYTKLNIIEGIVAFLQAYPKSTRIEIQEALKMEKSFIIRRLNELADEGKIVKIGNGPTVFYSAR